MQHQDAQELFQLVSECIKNEAGAVDKEGSRDRGFGTLLQNSERRIATSPFDGLTANRRSCVDCGYTEAVMHFAFDNWQLSVPRASSCRLEDCLADYTRIEVLTDCICRRCSMVATHNRLLHEVERLAEGRENDEAATYSKKKRGRETRKLEARVKLLLDEGRIEEDVKGLKMERVFSSASTKQAMIARPPPVLVLHLNRSMHFGTYAGKNSCHVLFPEILDLTPFTTSGQLSTRPEAPISAPPGLVSRSLTPTPASYAAPRVLYRLSAVVCHYGAHNFGHYVAFRRKPPVTNPIMLHALGCPCEACVKRGPLRDRGAPWLRISDDSVEEVPVERVLAETQGTFMLYYERIVQPQALPNASEETLRPPRPDGDADADAEQGARVERARSVARVVHAFERASRSPSVQQDASSLEPSPAPEASTSSPVHTDEAVPVQPAPVGSEDAATVVAKDIEEATTTVPNGEVPEASTPASPSTPSSSRISKRKGKLKRVSTVELRA
ncbi:cysteine proteinase [Auricularia subglabra TFB-10046 SS5]|uniref:ubiquitinyl hydrolase 1 n=1 Tax=Auricularia subglabra (strain TFB-10046 / SS5) TaxID=717982 RepID=J0WV36_AURST|nr:cysteine proteinase [Auricularia subglabra TFB-10046 SS5]